MTSNWHVVLVAPEIAPNTGNVVRLCANAGAALHLVEPLGFSLDARQLRRAGLDYHELTTVTVHPDLVTCLGRLTANGGRCFALSGRGHRRYDQVGYQDGDVLVFGAERSGLSPADLARFPQQHRLAIPMRPANRSLNLANAVAVVLYEAWRQSDFLGASALHHSQGTLAEGLGSDGFDATEAASASGP